MSILRVCNVNTRLVGTATTCCGSPGNAGQIGPTKFPYQRLKPCATLQLGQKYCGGGGDSCAGVFRLNESNCGNNECCTTATTTIYAGFFYDESGGYKYFASPQSTTATGVDWYNRNQAVTLAEANDACGDWFIPDSTQAGCACACREYWDPNDGFSWTNYLNNSQHTSAINYANGNSQGVGNANRSNSKSARAFRRISS